MLERPAPPVHQSAGEARLPQAPAPRSWTANRLRRSTPFLTKRGSCGLASHVGSWPASSRSGDKSWRDPDSSSIWRNLPGSQQSVAREIVDETALSARARHRRANTGATALTDARQPSYPQRSKANLSAAPAAAAFVVAAMTTVLSGESHFHCSGLRRLCGSIEILPSDLLAWHQSMILPGFFFHSGRDGVTDS